MKAVIIYTEDVVGIEVERQPGETPADQDIEVTFELPNNTVTLLLTTSQAAELKEKL